MPTDDIHQREHDAEADALDKALAADRAQQAEHNLAHEKAHQAHEEKHIAENEAVKTALDAVARERSIHATAHEKEHDGHQREHGLNNLAIEKAEAANDKRFGAANGYREAFEGRVREAATKEAVEGLHKELDRRIQALERNDVKTEGLRTGQGAIVAYIVTAVGLVGSILAIIIVIANVL